MKLYVNTTKQPPTLSESLSAKTDAKGVLQVYNSSFGSSLSSLRFKRGATVPLDFIFPDATAAADVAKLRFGIKLAGKFDDLLVLCAETTTGTTLADGSVQFSLKLKFDAAAIDSVLKVDSATDNDLANASFTAEVEWENSEGEITSTETVSAQILNNIIRGTTSASGATFGTWTALMVILMNWAEYSALEEINTDALYIVPDAPDELAEHEADADAHAEIFNEIRARITASQTETEGDAALNTAQLIAAAKEEITQSTNTSLLAVQTQAASGLSSHAATKATTSAFGHVRLATALTDDGDHAVPRAALVNTAIASKADSNHTHTIANVTGLQTALDGKAASSHTHTIANVTGLQTALDGKAASSHTHTIANVTGLQTALDAKATSATVTALGTRVSTNETNISTNASAITALESRIKTVALTQAQYDALTTKDANTLYAITAV